jgi:hypothetical protein
MPSATIQRWMQGPGAALAAERSEREPVELDSVKPRLLFGRHSETSPRTLLLEGCTVGRTSACEATLFGEPVESWDGIEEFEGQMIAAGVPLLDGRPASRGAFTVAEYSGPRTLDAIERRFGAEAFAAVLALGQAYG